MDVGKKKIEKKVDEQNVVGKKQMRFKECRKCGRKKQMTKIDDSTKVDDSRFGRKKSRSTKQMNSKKQMRFPKKVDEKVDEKQMKSGRKQIKHSN